MPVVLLNLETKQLTALVTFSLTATKYPDKSQLTGGKIYWVHDLRVPLITEGRDGCCSPGGAGTSRLLIFTLSDQLGDREGKEGGEDSLRLSAHPPITCFLQLGLAS